jgi:DNA mismatch repair protein MutS
MARPRKSPEPPPLEEIERAAAVEEPAEAAAEEVYSAAAMTPMMAQYTEIKAANPDSLLFYRMGDFYELFFEDAVTASQVLGIALTKRGKHLGADIPMCGVPIHAADDYLHRLITRGHRVAVCDQLEDPAEARKRGGKAVVRRDVVRLVTPGTLTEDTLLDARNNNFLSAIAEGAGGAELAIASLDISTGELLVGEVTAADLAGEIARLSPSEVLIADSAGGERRIREQAAAAGAALTPVPRAHFDSIAGERDLKSKLGVAELAGFGTFSRLELSAIAALLKYVDLTQIGRKPALRPPRKSGPGSVMVIDAATRANLELVRTTSGEKDGSLLAAIDRTVTGAGARELAARLASPLNDPKAIAARLDAVGFLIDGARLTEQLRGSLRSAPDIARALSRLSLGRGSPRDLGSIRDGLVAARSCRSLIDRAGGDLGLPEALATITTRLGTIGAALESELTAALADELPLNRRDGGFVREGYRRELDDNRQLRDQSRQVIAGLQTRYQDETGIKTLKVRHNNVLGYFIEGSALATRPLMSEPLSARFFHRQTLANAVRFTTAELSETEGRITAAAERALSLEQDVFADLAGRIAKEEAALGALAEALAGLDVLASLAVLATDERYVRPVIDQGLAFEIRGGRHPVVEQALRRAKAAPFIENDCLLGRATRSDRLPETGEGRLSGFDEDADARVWLVTGPNMAGKSTFLRQNALIAILAQMGSYVPARSAHIGIVDRLFSRVGASDDLARGRSTFMVEMVETAGILNQATARSLVILDEIGRGTATFDGLSIAWATVEYLHEVNRCRSLFATHYHELTALSGKLGSVANVTIEVREFQDDIVFLHKVVPGAADRSYGIQVAKLAGLPRPVIERAGEVLRLLEESDDRVSPEKLVEDLPLFAAARPRSHVPAATPAGPSPVEQALAAIHPDELTPREALEALYRLKGLIGRVQ